MTLRSLCVLTLVMLGCGGGAGGDQADQAAPTDASVRVDGAQALDAASASDAGPSDDGATPLAFSCAATTKPLTNNPCPPMNATAGKVTFCFRPSFAGVTSVQLYGGFGQAGDWNDPFLTLADDGSGTFVAATTLATGAYPYVFHVTGSADTLFKGTQSFPDQLNPSFVPAPSGDKSGRSASLVTVPLPATPPIYHLTGKVLFNGAPQPCYSVSVAAGELVTDMGTSEKSEANFIETGTDGSFDFPVAAGPFGITVRYPFFLAGANAAYPNPSVTPSLGYARTDSVTVSGDVAVAAIDMSYPDYARMMPAFGGSATLPVTFGLSVIPGAGESSVAVIKTNIAGNDPAYWGPFGTASTSTWNGAFGGSGNVVPGVTYYWGTWQRFDPKVAGGATWTAESLLFPITF
jgi:hypothetical protein